jgi:hypothetical protein
MMSPWGSESSYALPNALLLALSLQWIDGVIWKLRNQRLANPLTVGWTPIAPEAQKAA